MPRACRALLRLPIRALSEELLHLEVALRHLVRHFLLMSDTVAHCIDVRCSQGTLRKSPPCDRSFSGPCAKGILTRKSEVPLLRKECVITRPASVASSSFTVRETQASACLGTRLLLEDKSGVGVCCGAKVLRCLGAADATQNDEAAAVLQLGGDLQNAQVREE